MCLPLLSLMAWVSEEPCIRRTPLIDHVLFNSSGVYGDGNTQHHDQPVGIRLFYGESCDGHAVIWYLCG